MPKTSREQITDDEKKILHELQKNSKEKTDTIAKKCGFSRQKVWRAIKRLEKDKTIWGYHAVVDYNKIGLQQYFVLVKRTNKPFSKEHIDSIIKRVIKPEIAKMGIIVDNVSYVHGAFDGIHIIRASNVVQVKKYCEILNKLSKGYISDMKILEELFPIEKNGIVNPNVEELKDIFLTE
ncbi:MAG: Lrp/AsnC family transcriptional regulator [Thermoplasmatales archaeon]|nr:Lrp/AsnC family transcriptional regulator [Thermoplasmatales archaeon]